MFLMQVFLIVSQWWHACFLCVYFVYTCFLVQVFFVVSTHASNAYASWILAYFCASIYCHPCMCCICFMDTCLFLYKYLLSSMHVLHLLHGHLFIFVQVFIVVHTCASNAYALWTLAYFCTSIYCRPYMCF